MAIAKNLMKSKNWMYNSKSSRKVKWQNGQVITRNATARGQRGWRQTPAGLNRAYKPDMLNEKGNPKSATSISQ